MSAVAYLASYLSRARFIRSSVFASTLQRLVDWCSDYCTFKELDEKRINPISHSVFYSGCQAVMYVLCFRMRRLMDVPHTKSQLQHMPLKRILRNPLDPLKVCLPSIVTEFLRQAKAHQLFAVSEDYYFDNLIESDLSKAYGGRERLDTFFPFDPCLLKNCNRYIQPCFQSWSMANENDDNESSDEDVNMDEGFVDGNDECFLDDATERNFDDLDLEFEFENLMNKQMPRQMPARIRPSTGPGSP